MQLHADDGRARDPGGSLFGCESGCARPRERRAVGACPSRQRRRCAVDASIYGRAAVSAICWVSSRSGASKRGAGRSAAEVFPSEVRRYDVARPRLMLPGRSRDRCPRQEVTCRARVPGRSPQRAKPRGRVLHGPLSGKLHVARASHRRLVRPGGSSGGQVGPGVGGSAKARHITTASAEPSCLAQARADWARYRQSSVAVRRRGVAPRSPPASRQRSLASAQKCASWKSSLPLLCQALRCTGLVGAAGLCIGLPFSTSSAMVGDAPNRGHHRRDSDG